MKIKDLADLVGTTPRAIRHYHHEGLLPVPTNPGVRDYSLDHAVRLVRIRHLSESGLSLGTVRELLHNPDMSLDEELAAAEAGIDAQIEELERRRGRLRELRRQHEAGDTSDPLPYSVPERLSRFYDQVGPRLSAEARPSFEIERRAMEVAVRIPFAAALIDDWLTGFTPERLEATVDIYHFFDSLPGMSKEDAEARFSTELARYRAVFGPDWGVNHRAWRQTIRPILRNPGVMTLLSKAYPHPNQQRFIEIFLEEIAELMEGGVSRETSSH